MEDSPVIGTAFGRLNLPVLWTPAGLAVASLFRVRQLAYRGARPAQAGTLNTSAGGKAQLRIPSTRRV